MNGWLRDNLTREKYDPTLNEYTFPESKTPSPVICESLDFSGPRDWIWTLARSWSGCNSLSGGSLRRAAKVRSSTCKSHPREDPFQICFEFFTSPMDRVKSRTGSKSKILPADPIQSSKLVSGTCISVLRQKSHRFTSKTEES
jgi:hypothetical protein